ncbi:rCG24756 [Rattus norvegicus]|uniref:RCG24756 n=1 Tax=Rattus norvegicus TaxID=10116 RepID=A6JC22_RAT|nr:rCG24756 [Rattus norvegicus]
MGFSWAVHQDRSLGTCCHFSLVLFTDLHRRKIGYHCMNRCPSLVCHWLPIIFTMKSQFLNSHRHKMSALPISLCFFSLTP